MTRFLTTYEPQEFSDDSYTERGEKVYKTLRVVVRPLGAPPVERVLTCDKGVGITEEWIEDTISGCEKALEKDFPADRFQLLRHSPNDVEFLYAGVRGAIQ